jgi:hypothetical protein
MCLVTDNPEAWHCENLARNPAHYSSLLRVGWPRNFLQTMRKMQNFVKQSMITLLCTKADYEIIYKQCAKCEISLNNDHFHETFRNATEQTMEIN